MGHPTSTESHGLFLELPVLTKYGIGATYNPLIFENRPLRVEVVALNQMVEIQYKTTSQIEKICKELRLKVD